MIVAGTGHRPDKLGGYTDEASKRLQSLAEFWLRNVNVEGVISGMALGWDQALAWAAVELNIPFYAYIPFVGQEKAWPKQSQSEYHLLLDHAHAVKECSEPGYAVWKMQHRNKCMVDDALVVLALWNGSDGGTANCIEYAKKQNKQVVNLWPTFSLITGI